MATRYRCIVKGEQIVEVAVNPEAEAEEQKAKAKSNMTATIATALLIDASSALKEAKRADRIRPELYTGMYL